MIFHAKRPPLPPPPYLSLLYIIYHISLLHPRWDEQCRDTMMTVPPQLTSSLPSFSYPASFRHPPPASSLYNIMIYIYTYTCISRTYPLFLLHPFHSPLRTVLRCEVLLDSPELALRLQILAKDSRSWATQASLAPWRRCWWKLETYVEAKLVIYTLYIYIYTYYIYIYTVYILYIYIYIYCIYIYNINLYVVCFETTH